MENAAWNHQYYNSQYPSAAAVQSHPPQNETVFNSPGCELGAAVQWIVQELRGHRRSSHVGSEMLAVTALVTLLTRSRSIPTHQQQQAWSAPPTHQAPREQHLSSIGAGRVHHGSVHNANAVQNVGRPVYIPSTVVTFEPNYPSALPKLLQRQGEIISDRIEEPDEEAESPMEGPALRISCPYYLRAPHAEHRSSACRGRAFLDISRLKDHLVKIHDQRIPQRMTGQSTEAKWKSIWKSLFGQNWPDKEIPAHYWTGIEACENHVLDWIKEKYPGAPSEEVRRAFESFKSRPLPGPGR
ncbi:hypothetical protein IWX90DRAFT_417494 [Phyllosticta citrichinensis]|uniref:Uncharacterized protein n=1 Tax=Phyllosticta citrichinensis TaxID=1130410 RepID=A0ABR1XLM5_9PEZI